MQIGTKVVVIDYPSGIDRSRIIGKSGVVKEFKSKYFLVAVEGDTLGVRLFLPTELKEVAEHNGYEPVKVWTKPGSTVNSKLVQVSAKDAQENAVALGLKLGEVSLNDVYYSFSKIHNVSADQIELEDSNAVFVGGAWEKSTVEVKSNRKVARGRKIAVWTYTPFKLAAKSVTKAYRVEVNYPPELKWYPSNNAEVRGKVYGSFEDAQKAADEQKKEMGEGYNYRGAEIV